MATTSNRSNLSIVREAYKAFNKGDIQTVLNQMHGRVEWIEPEGGTMGGTYRGKSEVKEKVFGRIGETFEEFTVDVDDYMDCGRESVVVGHLNGTTRSGKSLEIPFAHVIEIKDLKITRFQNYTDTALWNETVGE